MKPLPNPLAYLFLLWLLGAYIFSTLLLGWSGLSSHSNAIFEVMASFIPSILGYAELSPNREKAIFELCLAWLFSLAVPVLMLSALDWNWINERAIRRGNPLKTGLLILATGVLLLAVVLYPDPPSDSRRTGRVISSLFKSDYAFIWGAAVTLLAGLGFLSLVAGIIQIYTTIIRQNAQHG